MCKDKVEWANQSVEIDLISASLSRCQGHESSVAVAAFSVIAEIFWRYWIT